MELLGDHGRLTPVQASFITAPRRRVRLGRGTRVLAALGIAAAAILTGARPASAHAVLEGTTPAANATVKSAPSEIVLNFSAEVALATQGPQLFDAKGQEVTTGSATLSDQDRRVTIPVEAELANGTYSVTWRVRSTDGHALTGAFTFNVGAASEGGAVTVHAHSTSKAVGVSTGVLRFIGFASFTVAVGSLLFVAICTPHLAGTRRAQLLTAIALWVLGVAAIAQCFALHPFTNGGNFGDIASFKHFRESLELDHGKALVIRFGLALVGILLFAKHRLRGRRFLGLLMVGSWVAALAATFALVGHPRSGRWQTLAIILDAAHLVAAAAWVGGLFALIVLVLIVRESTEHQSVALRFGTIAASSVAIVAGSGAIQAIRQMTTISDFWDETYGRLLAVKLIAVGLILLVAARSRWLTKGEDTNPRELRTMVVIETVGVAFVLAVTSLLVNSPPPFDTRGVAAQSPVGPATASVSEQGVDFEVTLDPAAVGASTMTVQASKQGADAELFELHASIELSDGSLPPIEVTFADGHPQGVYTSQQLTIPRAGNWTVKLRALTSPLDQFETTTTLRVG